MIQQWIEELLAFALYKEMIQQSDIYQVRNALYDTLQFTPEEEIELVPQQQVLQYDTADFALEKIMDYCVEKRLIADVMTERDLMNARIMGLLMPRSSEVIKEFWTRYQENGEKATNRFYDLCRSSNYIQVERILKNKYWQAQTPYGNLEITVNLSKPEKDPKEIAAAKSQPQSGYPKCQLCIENVGFAGHYNHPARQNLRVIPIELTDQRWYFQYSPYVYYNEHCIVFNEKHVPMKINKDSFKRLIEFVDIFPHYFIGSNADLPIVGGSILTHDHFQGGRHIFPMAVAEPYAYYQQEDFPGLTIDLVRWPMSVIRVSGKGSDELIAFADGLLQKWRDYSDESVGIRAYTNDETGKTPHNTITPIARKNKQGLYELDLVLRNNRTTKEHPLGLFHPHGDLHHIKKENIGLIEVMGLAVLPGRLDQELKEMEKYLYTEMDMSALTDEQHSLHQHGEWLNMLYHKYGGKHTPDEAKTIIETEIGFVFQRVLEDAGVFKDTEEGRRHFEKFMKSAGCKKK